MSEEGRRWKWWHKAALGIALVLANLWGVLATIRKPWVEALPGVRVEPSLPIVTESELGPTSAYGLFRQVTEMGPGYVVKGSTDVWPGDWRDAFLKFEQHGWPAQPLRASSVGEQPGYRSGRYWQIWPNAFGHGGLVHIPVAAWTSEQVQDLPRVLKAHEPELALLDRILADPSPQMPVDAVESSEEQYLPGVMELTALLLTSAWYRSSNGDHVGAFQDLARIRGLRRTLCSGGLPNDHLSACTLDALAVDAAWKIATRQDIPGPVLRQGARDFLASADGAVPLVEAVRAEAMKAEKSVREHYLGTRTSGPRGLGAMLGGLEMLLSGLQGSNAKTSTRNVRAAFQHLIAIADKPYSPTSSAEYGRLQAILMSPLDPWRTSDPRGHMLATMLVPCELVQQAHTRATVTDANLKGIALFLAIRAYEKVRGELPERLAQLVPDFLPRVPHDPFDCKPFRYLRTGVPGLPADAWAIYSIGPDFVDNGGTAHGTGTSHAPALGASPDLVWPSHAYPVKSAGKQTE